MACERQAEVKGPDASRFVRLLTPRNLDDCAPGQGRYVLLAAPDGGITNDAVMLCLAEARFHPEMVTCSCGPRESPRSPA